MVLELLNNYTTNKYIQSVIILLIFFVISQLVVFVSQRIIIKITKRTRTEVDDLIVSKTNKPISFILLLIGIRLAIIPHKIRADYLDIIENLISTLIIGIITYIVIVVFDIIINNWGKKFASKTESKVDDEIVVLFQKLSRIIIGLIGLLFILDAWGVKVTPLLASLGIVGIAVAFALQNTLGNIFGGVSLIVDRSITVDDFIRLDDGTEGFVKDIGMRSTKIKNLDGDLIILPNGKLADSKIYNYHKPLPSTRVTVDFGVKYGTEVEKVKKIVMHELNRINGILKEPAPEVIFEELGDFSLKFKAFFWVSSIEKKIEAKEAAVTAIYNALNKNKIGIPFPTRTVYLMKNLKK